MATWNDVRALALALPGTEERLSRGTPQWTVAGKSFVWDRPLRGKDLEHREGEVPQGPILAAYVEDDATKQALVQGESQLFFTTPHFDGYAIVLVLLEKIDAQRLEEVVAEAWRSRAPSGLALP